MNKLKTLAVIFVLLLFACNTKTNHKSPEADDTSRRDVAIKFINDYVKYCNSDTSRLNSVKWVESNELTTTEFKQSYKDIIEKASKEDPEMGLGFDPIFDSQDYPEKGFEFLKSYDDGFIIVKGIDWPDFTIVIKIKSVKGKWMVNGAGIINVPEDRRAKR